MDTRRKITGIWKGTYSHDPVEHMREFSAVPFTLTLRQGWFGRFSGTVTDDGLGGMPGIGGVKGWFSFPCIKFTKRMPVCYVATPDGRSITLREFLVENGHTCDRDVPHVPIYYNGQFSSPKQAQGIWIIKAGPILLGDGRTISMPETTGSWRIES